MTTFGVDFYRHLQDSNTEEENIPHIISSCIDEIDKRGMNSKLCEPKGVFIRRKVVPGGRITLYTEKRTFCTYVQILQIFIVSHYLHTLQ